MRTTSILQVFFGDGEADTGSRYSAEPEEYVFLFPSRVRKRGNNRPGVFCPHLARRFCSMTQDCRQCGKCCEKWGWDQKGIIDDLVPWIAGNRQDILVHVLIRFSDGRYSLAAGMGMSDLPRVDRIYYWVDAGMNKLRICPFFERREDGKVYCRIHDTKPAVCVGFAPWATVWHDYGLNCPACRDITP